MLIHLWNLARKSTSLQHRAVLELNKDLMMSYPYSMIRDVGRKSSSTVKKFLFAIILNLIQKKAAKKACQIRDYMDGWIYTFFYKKQSFHFGQHFCSDFFLHLATHRWSSVILTLYFEFQVSCYDKCYDKKKRGFEMVGYFSSMLTFIFLRREIFKMTKYHCALFRWTNITVLNIPGLHLLQEYAKMQIEVHKASDICQRTCIFCVYRPTIHHTATSNVHQDVIFVSTRS